MKYYLIILCLLISVSGEINAQFIACNSPTTKDLYDVHFVDLNTGIAVGDSGIIIRTTDGGSNWNTVLTMDTVTFQKVKFFNNQNGIAIGSDIYITENGGSSWNKIENPNSQFFDVALLNDSTCILSGFPNRIIKSTNYGQDWQTITSDSLDYKIRYLSFIDQKIGYASFWNGSIINSTLKTIDGGYSWHVIADESGDHITLIEDISFISEDIGFRGGWYNSHLMRTSNGSKNWANTTIIDSINTLVSGIFDFHIEQSLPNSYFSCGWHGDIFKSTDGGNNWYKLNSGITSVLNAIYFVDDNYGWIVGQHGKILKTDNGGEFVSTTNLNELREVIIYPNPVSNTAYIKKPASINIQIIQIYDNNGSLLKTINQPSGKIDMSTFPCGIIHIKIVSDKGIFVKKVSKIKII